MKVICKQTTSEGFDLNEVATVFSNNFDYSFGGHGLELGTEYIVMGMLLYKDSKCLYYLIDVNGRPDWFPHLLFSTSENSLPHEWFIRVNNKNEHGVYCIWGFDELCNSENFYEQLIDRDEQAMGIYFRRKIEIEKSLGELS